MYASKTYNQQKKLGPNKIEVGTQVATQLSVGVKNMMLVLSVRQLNQDEEKKIRAVD